MEVILGGPRAVHPDKAKRANDLRRIIRDDQSLAVQAYWVHKLVRPLESILRDTLEQYIESVPLGDVSVGLSLRQGDIRIHCSQAINEQWEAVRVNQGKTVRAVFEQALRDVFEEIEDIPIGELI